MIFISPSIQSMHDARDIETVFDQGNGKGTVVAYFRGQARSQRAALD
jgi:hypothetical protein